MTEAGKTRPRNGIGLMMLVLVSTSCSSSTGGKCGPELRSAGADGMVILADGISSAVAGVVISEARDPGQPYVPMVSIRAKIDSLKFHMTGAELRDTEVPSRLLRAFTTGFPPPLPTDPFLGFDGPYDWSIDFEAGRALLLAGHLVIDIYTDLPGQPPTRVPLLIVDRSNENWTRGSCSG